MTVSKPDTTIGWPRRLPLAVTDHHIKFEADCGLGPSLVCPRCNSDYLHSSRITIFDRPEDHNYTTVTAVQDGLVANHLIPSGQTENPSGRRHAVAVEFDCEGCGDHGPIELDLSQHKGNTFVTWRYDPIAEIDRLEAALKEQSP